MQILRSGLLVCLSLIASGCPIWGDTEEREPASPRLFADCSGDNPDNGCNDCNPCTYDWQTLGVCYHDERTSPIEVRNDCFPIFDSDPAEAGVCCAGVCVPNRAGWICGVEPN